MSKKPETIVEKLYPLTVVRIGGELRCVYVNDYRLVGERPYVSEVGEYEKLEFTLEGLRKAFPKLKIEEFSSEDGGRP